jgi:hypothetical protein
MPRPQLQAGPAFSPFREDSLDLKRALRYWVLALGGPGRPAPAPDGPLPTGPRGPWARPSNGVLTETCSGIN